MPAMKPDRTHFKKIQNFKVDYAIAEFTQYESARTGLRVAVVDRKGPKISGWFTLATEIHDDSGAPHTLEHLCFMGSKNYKYKGILDKLATRAYSSTNAWTATDNTTYTLTSAGWEGFAQILPTYLEHILLPTLTDAGCYTEVWHIDGTGNDAGVVYSEMQGVQNEQGSLMDLSARRHLYPEGNGFRYETGGMMEQLRVLTADRIRKFHRAMYQPKNLRLVLIGEVDHVNLLDILEEFEDSIVDDVPSIDVPFTRPWVESKPTPPLEKDIVDVVEFPEEDESTGEIMIAFFGPEFQNSLENAGIDVLLIYLAGSSVTILENTLVEKEHLASAVYNWTENRPNQLIWFNLSSVATKKLADVEKRFFEVLREATSKPFDMDYMGDSIRRFRRQVVYAAESGHDIFSDPIIYDHLFADREGKDLEDSLATLKALDTLEKWTDRQWRDFADKYLANNRHVSILGTPSAKLAKKLKKDEKARVKAQQEKLGEDGLKKLAEKLDVMKAENDKEVPEEILEKFKIPETDSIHFIPSTTARSGLAKKMGVPDNDVQQIIDKDDSDTPLFIHFEDIPTNFVHFSLLINTSSIPVELKPLLPLYLVNFFVTPVNKDDKDIGFEEMIMRLEQDTIQYNIGDGSAAGNSEVLRIKFVVEIPKYSTAISWVKTLLFDSVFDPERLKASLAKMIAEIPDEKRRGDSMADAVDSMLHFNNESSIRAQNTLVKALYLRRINKLLSTDPSAVIARMESVRKALCSFSNLRLLVISNLSKLSNPVSSWKLLTDALDTPLGLSPLDTRRAVLSPAALAPGSLTHIIPMGTIDSSYANFAALGPLGYDHPLTPALKVAIAYLDAVEGPMWVGIRGTGLAYGTNFAHSPDTGLASFSIYRSPDSFKAYRAARTVLQEFVSGKREFEKSALDGAISTIVVGFANEQPTMVGAANVGFVNQVVKGIPKDWGTTMLKKVREVSREQIREVMEKFLLPVLEPEKADLVVTCASIMEEVSRSLCVIF
ncbi:putative zinc metalloprotease [Aulographum hederae CBS 113979]|uniref:Presequence protease, mitochondrial n=1 Tax=Aulographum hederae CBS 113979 TaxID=1176131 RepID=A0A6G1GU55_9PEZI|nr:putative zinc metalloprotease [Aulographum hederae CBS 113979]